MESKNLGITAKMLQEELNALFDLVAQIGLEHVPDYRLWIAVLCVLEFLNAEDTDERIKREGEEVRRTLQRIVDEYSPKK